LPQIFPRHFCFHDHLLRLQEEVHPACIAGIRRGPFLGPNIREM
jgi:hypothetical protein